MVECVTLVIRLLISMIRSQATVAPLLRWLSTKHNLIDLAEKAFPKRIEGHKQEDVNTQSDIANMDEVNHKRGSRT